MKKTEMREVIVIYCDCCGVELTGTHASIEYKDGRKLDLCSNYIENDTNCFQKQKEIDLIWMYNSKDQPVNSGFVNKKLEKKQ